MQKQSYQKGTLSLIERKSGNKWVFRYRTNEGVQKAIIVGSQEKYKSKADAWKAVSSLQSEINDNVECVLFRQLIDRYSQEELPERKSTESAVRSNLKRLRADFEADKLIDLAKNPMKIENWLKELKTLPTPTRPAVPLSRTTKKHLHGLMHQLFDRAVVWKYLTLVRNPMDTVKIKGKANKKKTRLVIEGHHLNALLQDKELPLMVKVMLVVGIFSGMRASEILGLRWEALDFEAGVIHVERSVVGSTKTTRRRRRRTPLSLCTL